MSLNVLALSHTLWVGAITGVLGWRWEYLYARCYAIGYHCNGMVVSSVMFPGRGGLIELFDRPALGGFLLRVAHQRHVPS